MGWNVVVDPGKCHYIPHPWLLRTCAQTGRCTVWTRSKAGCPLLQDDGSGACRIDSSSRFRWKVNAYVIGISILRCNIFAYPVSALRLCHKPDMRLWDIDRGVYLSPLIDILYVFPIAGRTPGPAEINSEPGFFCPELRKNTCFIICMHNSTAISACR